VQQKFFGELAEIDSSTIADWNKLARGWRRNCLRRSLHAICMRPEAEDFLEPVAYEGSQLLKYQEVVQHPIDLGTIEEKLREGLYYSAEGIDADLFWADISSCWENCKRYHGYDETVEACHVAETMRLFSEELMGKYWSELGELLREAGADRNEHTPTSASPCSKDTGPEEEEARDGPTDEDVLIHKWCKKQLRLCLQTLLKNESEGAEKCASSSSTDLGGIGERFTAGAYEDSHKLIDPDLFWKDIRKCWSGKRKDRVEPHMGVAARELEQKFRRALDRFEKSMEEAEVALSSI